jgi:nucleoside-diphosphate-sugar epimerase
MAKYFVTGATGFIGGEIVKQLVGRGHKVVALVRSPEKAGVLKALGIEIHAGDITDRETLKAPMTASMASFMWRPGTRSASKSRSPIRSTSTAPATC